MWLEIELRSLVRDTNDKLKLCICNGKCWFDWWKRWETPGLAPGRIRRSHSVEHMSWGIGFLSAESSRPEGSVRGVLWTSHACRLTMMRIHWVPGKNSPWIQTKCHLVDILQFLLVPRELDLQTELMSQWQDVCMFIAHNINLELKAYLEVVNLF